MSDTNIHAKKLQKAAEKGKFVFRICNEVLRKKDEKVDPKYQKYMPYFTFNLLKNSTQLHYQATYVNLKVHFGYRVIYKMSKNYTLLMTCFPSKYFWTVEEQTARKLRNSDLDSADF